MPELLFQKFDEKIELTDEEKKLSRSFFVPKKLRKRQYLLQEGDVCKYQAFVEKGIMRSYTIDEKGDEHILQFASEGWWMADLSSFITEEPSVFNVEVLEDVELLLISKSSWELLMQKIPAFEHFFRILIQNNLIATQKRLLQSLSESAEEKYHKFTEIYPSCVLRVPQHMIASYLGISRETLSRLRKHIASRK